MAEALVLNLFVLLPCLGIAGLWLFFKRFELHRATRCRWLLLLAGNALVLFALASVSLALGEAYFRWCYDTTESFQLTKTTDRWFARHFHKNRSGFRDTVDYYPQVRAAGKKRLVILGDSFTAGQGVADVEHIYPCLLRRDLPGWEIHIHAFPGWDTPHQINELTLMADLDYEVDVVLLAYCLNDISQVVPEWLTVAKSFYQDQNHGLFVDHSYLFNSLYFRLYWVTHPEVTGYFDYLANAYVSEPWQTQTALLTNLHEIVTQRLNARLLVVTIPFLHCLGKDYPFRAAHDQLDELWTRLQVPHLDLLKTFETSRPADVTVNRLDAHPNERAHALVAQTLLPFLRANLPANQP